MDIKEAWETILENALDTAKTNDAWHLTQAIKRMSDHMKETT